MSAEMSEYNPETAIEELCEKHNLELGQTDNAYQKIKAICKLKLLHHKLLEFVESKKHDDILVIEPNLGIHAINRNIKTEKADDISISKESAQAFTRRGQAEAFYAQQPYFYDKAKLFWLWNNQRACYEHVDEVDLYNRIDDLIDIGSFNYKVREEILSALKQVGRLHIPKPMSTCWVQFRQTVYDFQADKEFPASHEYFFTAPIPYLPSQNKETPVIDKLFREWVVGGEQGENYVQTLYEIISYATSSSQFLQTILALTGSGANGKGTFLKLIEHFLGRENCCASSLRSLIARPFETSALHKKLACFLGEVDAGDLTHTALLKQLSGEDLLRYEYKGKTPFSDSSPTTVIIATNSLPTTPDKSKGFYRRWLIVDFPNTFSIKYDVLAQIPEEEYSNLARKVMNILKDLHKRQAFTNHGSMEEREARYESRSNPLQKFLEQCCLEESGEHTPLRIFGVEFNQWLKHHHLKQLTIIRIGKALRDEGFEISSRKVDDISSKVILNLRLIKPEDTTITGITGISTNSIHIETTEKSGNLGNSSNFYELSEPMIIRMMGEWVDGFVHYAAGSIYPNVKRSLGEKMILSKSGVEIVRI